MAYGLRRGRGRGVGCLLVAALVVVCVCDCFAARPARTLILNEATGKVSLQVGKSVIVSPVQPITRISLAADGIADYVLLSPTQIYLTGKAAGLTNMTLWGSEDKVVAVYDIEVAPDISRLKAKLHQVLPDENGIQVDATHESLAISGTVTSARNMAHALDLAEAYSPGKDGKVINQLQVTGVHQVMLEVRVAEMARSLRRRLGVNFIVGNDGSIGGSLIGNIVNVDEFVGNGEQGAVNLTFSQALNSFFHIAGGDFTWTQFLDALKEEGLVRVLAEPTLLTLSGQTASFLAGGEFPIPVPQGLGTVAIEYKQFGVGLSFTPTVLDARRISINVQPEVSELDFSTAVLIQGFTVPGLTTRRVSTMVELADGQSFAIAGLLRDTVKETISRFPMLGELPVLGPLFRSTSFQRNETELVIIVTPHLVKPLDMAKQKLPTDGFIEPSDYEFFLLGLMKGRGAAFRPKAPLRGGVEGEFGHAVPKY